MPDKSTATPLENAIFITGAGQRVGEYLARQFLELTDYPVVFSYRTQRLAVTELEQKGAVSIQCDFTEENALENLVKKLNIEVNSLRAVIHNASLWMTDEQAPCGSEEFHDLFKVHVETPIYLNQQLAPLLLKNTGLKDIISLSDFRVSKTDASKIGYMASKAALQNLTKNFAAKFAPEIKVNDIAPALIVFNKDDDEAYKQNRLQEALLPIEPGEEVVWQAVQYLMNSPYTTGSCLQLNGGRNLK